MKERQTISIRLNDKLIDDNRELRIVFGPHHYINLKRIDNSISFELGCTHHGVKFDASVVDSELYRAIEFLRDECPLNKTD